MKPVILPPLLNREFKLPEDGLFQFAPLGEYPIIDPVTKNRVIQVVDEESLRSMAADIAARKAAIPNWPGLLVDRDHFSFDLAKESRAAGWANEAQARADGLFGPIRFTSSGKADVEGGDYRFLSPVFERSSAVPLGGSRFRVMKLRGLALTNKPNIAGIQALTNRTDEFPGLTAGNRNTTEGPAMKDRLIQLMKMGADATDDAVIGAVTAFMNRASELDALKGTHATLVTEHDALKNRHTVLLTTNVEATLEANKDIIPESDKDQWKNRLTEDFDGTSKLLKGLKRPEGKRQPTHEAGKGAAAAAKKTGDEDGDPFLNRVAEVRAADKSLGQSAAILRVAGEEPELYDAYRNRLAGETE